MKLILMTGIILFNAIGAYAQCDNCYKMEKKPDYCFTDSLLPGKCAQFYEKDTVFYFAPVLNPKKAPAAYKFPSMLDMKGLVEFSKAYPKLTPQDIIFLMFALSEWDIQRINVGFVQDSCGISIKMISEGTGKRPEINKKVKVHYRGYLADGTVFDSSFERNSPIEFTLGTGQVIKGWDLGIPLFKVGSKGTIRIPSELGYGSRGAGGVIPPNAVLYFDIEVVSAE